MFKTFLGKYWKKICKVINMELNLNTKIVLLEILPNEIEKIEDKCILGNFKNNNS